MFGFTGEETDANGLVNLRARYYNPTLGQFMSLDPLDLGNRYQYVGGNPVNRRDRSGLCADELQPVCNLIEEAAPGEFTEVEKTRIVLGAYHMNEEGEIIEGMPVDEVVRLNPILEKLKREELLRVISVLSGVSWVGLVLMIPSDEPQGSHYWWVAEWQDAQKAQAALRQAQATTAPQPQPQPQQNPATQVNDTCHDNKPRNCDSEVYRVQGGIGDNKKSKELIEIAPDGGMNVRFDLMGQSQEARLWVTFDNADRALDYAINNRLGAYIIAFKLDSNFVGAVRGVAQHEKAKAAFIVENSLLDWLNVPIIGDAHSSYLLQDDNSRLYTSFGLPRSWVPGLQAAVCRGTGYIVP